MTLPESPPVRRSGPLSGRCRLLPDPWFWATLAIVLTVLVAVFVSEVDEYGVGWDEALGDLFFGQRYLSFYLSFDPTYLDFSADPYPEGHRPDLRWSHFRGRPWEYPPLAATVGAATSSLVAHSGLLGSLDELDGFHLANLWFGLLFLVPFALFVRQRSGNLAALATVLLLMTNPRVLVHWLANLKDFPSLALYSLTILAGLRAWEKPSWRRVTLAGVLWGLALATRANALFVPITLLLAFLWTDPPGEGADERLRKTSGFDQDRGWPSRMLRGAGAGAVGLLALMLVWPYLWADPVGRFLLHLRYLTGRAAYAAEDSLSPVLESVVLTSPPIFLILAVAGFVTTARAVWARDRWTCLLWAWSGVALGRYLIPGAVNFDGVRHFLELFPALAALGGLAVRDGITWLAHRSSRRDELVRSLFALLGLVAVALPGTMTIARTHPFELAYWNRLAGGLSGARADGRSQAGDYWAWSYRQGMRWLDRHLPPNAALAVPIAEHVVRVSAPTRLRSDIVLLPLVRPYSPEIAPDRWRRLQQLATRHPVYVMSIERSDWDNRLTRDCRLRLEPIQAWTLDGEVVLRIDLYRPADQNRPRP